MSNSGSSVIILALAGVAAFWLYGKSGQPSKALSQSPVQSSSVTAGSTQPQPVATMLPDTLAASTPSVDHTNTGPSGERNYNDDVQSELAARLFSAQFKVPIAQARTDIQQPKNAAYKISAMGMARAGQLDYLLNGGWTP